MRIHLGSVDPRFNLSQAELLSDITNSSDLWSKAYGKPLFLYDNQADLTINMVFDKRQSLNNQINNLENKLSDAKNNLKPQIEQYQKKVEDFKAQLKQFNDLVDSWNNRGGAPPDEYNKLIEQQKQLKAQADQLNQEATSLHQSTASYNLGVNQLSQTVDVFNQAIEKKPEEGLFDPAKNTIDIYFNVNRSQLIHTLAHELGHSLGIDHNQNPSSIMYPYTTDNINLSQDDLSSLKMVCAPHSVAEIEYSKLVFLVRKFSLNPV